MALPHSVGEPCDHPRHDHGERTYRQCPHARPLLLRPAPPLRPCPQPHPRRFGAAGLASARFSLGVSWSFRAWPASGWSMSVVPEGVAGVSPRLLAYSNTATSISDVRD